MSTAEQFQLLCDRYLTGLNEFWPNQASLLGLHEYDNRQPNLSGDSIRARLQAVQALAHEVAALDPAELIAEQGFDYRFLQAALELELFQWEGEQAYRQNPMWYLGAIEFVNFLVRNYAPFEERLRGVIGYLQNTPSILAAARENLDASLPRPMIEVSLGMFEGMLTFYEKDLQAALAPLQNDLLREQVLAARETAHEAVAAFIRDLREQYLPRANDNFAIGEENYRWMLRSGEMVELPIETLLEVGEQDLARNLAGIREKARQIDPDLSLEQVDELLKRDHPTALELIPATRELLEEIRQFLIDRSIVSVPSEVRAQVEETPAFMRWAFAMMDTPGPFETTGTEAYYYITPPETTWPEEKQTEWLSFFNRYALRNVSVHEAYPGHYVNFLHVSYMVHSRLRQAFSMTLSYAFTEGWAHYCEEMMLDAGYGEHNPRLRFAQLQDALLRDCRYICSIRMHTRGMTVEEATRFFMENAVMSELTARQEALRGTFEPRYLYYTLGKLMLLKLREDVKTREGTTFNLKDFHDELLSYGTPPIPLLREEMLGTDSGSLL